LAKSSLLAHTTLWITVQGRVVFIEGCVRSEASGARLESLAHAVPYVQQAIANVYVPGARHSKPRYRMLSETPVSKAPP
jgi:hypothetical protein